MQKRVKDRKSQFLEGKRSEGKRSEGKRSFLGNEWTVHKFSKVSI